ncbi:hypothetical protein ACJMK2_016615 [Sinanodonta woodiana]|uniref:BTB domain-containing protein n=1 Tax=Sinanodonta woodiana TaxID=1069815 RepID=A0ABD3UU74_SINWO
MMLTFLGQSASSDDVSSETSTSYKSGEHSGYLIQNMDKFREDKGFTDITIDVEGRQFACHKVILAAGSPYFRSMFSSGMEECRKEVIELKHLDSEVFEQVLRFIYTGHVNINQRLVEDVFTQAHILQISTLVDLCVEFFKANMNDNNCLAALTLADIHAHQPLYEFAKELTCQYFHLLAKEEDIYKLSSECIIDLLKDRRLNCPIEEVVLETALKWLETDLHKRKAYRYKLLETIKFPFLSKVTLLDVVANCTHVMNDERGKELFEDAMVYHTLPARRPMLSSYQITPRWSFPVIEIAVLLGGRLSDGLSNDVECYTSESKEPFSLRQLPFKKRNEYAVCVVGNNIFVSGGLRSAEFWKYDSSFDMWMKGANLLNARRRHGMAAVDDHIYVLGGFDEDNVLSTVESWQFESNKWEDSGVLAQPVENMGFVSFGKKIYLFGGKNHNEVVTNCVQCYDTATRQCCCILTSELPANDMCLTAVVLNSQIYVVGLEGVFRFSPQTETWEILPEQEDCRDFVSLAVLDEKIYAFGGRRRGAKDYLYTDIIECFDPKLNRWSRAGNMPVAMYSYGCTRIIMNKKVKIEQNSLFGD